MRSWRAAGRAALIGSLLPMLGSAPAAAAGAAVCSMKATVVQSPPSLQSGEWSIESGVLDCHGQVGGALITGPGQLAGSGSFGELAPGGTCAHDAGQGTFTYTIPTTRLQLRFVEPVSFVAAGGIVFNTPTLAGTLVVTGPVDGGCITKPVTRAGVQGAAVLLRPGYV